MNFTAREDYGLRAVLDLAMHASQGPIQSKEIATRQSIPEQFLEQLLGALRRGGLVRSVRGASGGYLLASTAEAITAGDVLRVLSGPLVPIECLQPGHSESCEHQASLGVHLFWSKLSDVVTKIADGLSIQDLIDLQMAADEQASFMMHI